MACIVRGTHLRQGCSPYVHCMHRGYTRPVMSSLHDSFPICLKKFWKGDLEWQWSILRIHAFLRLLHKLHPISQSWADMMEEESPDMPLLFEDLLRVEPSLKEADSDTDSDVLT